MKLPEKITEVIKLSKNSQSGQILIIFLLILVVGLAITLSIASRTVIDVRQTTTSEESNKAYFAAEAGVEDALKKIEAGTAISAPYQLDFSTVNNSVVDVSVRELRPTSVEAFAFNDKVGRDEVSQVSLMQDFNNTATACASACADSIHYDDRLEFFWGTANPIPALELTVLYLDSGNNFGIKKFTYDPDASRRASNNFCYAAIQSNTKAFLSVSRSYGYYALLTLNNRADTTAGMQNCLNNDQLVSTEKPVLARIRLLYNTTPVYLAVQKYGGILPNQGQRVESIGKTPSGVTRKLIVSRQYPALPSMFDYVLFNGDSSNPLSK